ncbi:MAG: metallophosphoesterase [Oscillospiraceae bacterium]|nr:metallophosphoesterase [Oscillospiraceae bacterium]
MSLYAIGDLHLALSDLKKPMDIFNGWEGYTEKIEKNWRACITENDTVVLAGDTSWAMGLENSFKDFEFINNLPGKKIILKGNHDYWWATMSKMQKFFSSNNFDTLSILFNNCYQYEKYGLCGTRGWISIDGDTESEKIMVREVQRLEVSINSAIGQGLEPIVFMHYPPVYGASCNYDILDVLYRYNIKWCLYGHIHGYSQRNAVTGVHDGVRYDMISSDFLQFAPFKVL